MPFFVSRNLNPTNDKIMQQKYLTLTNDEIFVALAALNNQRRGYLEHAAEADRDMDKAAMRALAGRCNTVFLKLANAQEAAPLPLRRVHPLRRFWRRLVRKSLGGFTCSAA